MWYTLSEQRRRTVFPFSPAVAYTGMVNSLHGNSFLLLFIAVARRYYSPLYLLFFSEVLSISAKELLINEEIKAAQVRVIDNEGNQLGVIPVKSALEMAYQSGLDLVEISPNGQPPVCRIMDYGKYRFEREKKEKESKKKRVIIETKEIKLSCRIDTHDLNTKLGHALRFLLEGNKVKINIVFSGREMQYTSRGFDLMAEIEKKLEEVGTVEKKPSLDGRFMTMFLAPKKATAAK